MVLGVLLLTLTIVEVGVPHLIVYLANFGII